jgi:hypothetical protein
MAQQAEPAEDVSVEKQKYPSWYPDKKIVNKQTVMHAYVSAIGEDSAAAVSKAVEWGKAELKSYLSDKLENIRSEALVEYGSDSGLDASRFLIALRKADEVVNALAEEGKTKVTSVNGQSSYRSFVEVSVNKDDLIKRIGRRLAGYEKQWEAMKSSEAFNNF